MSAYHADLIQDLQVQLKDFHKSRQEIYYWHGPRRAIPTTLRTLASHWKAVTEGVEHMEVPVLDAQDKVSSSPFTFPSVAFELSDYERLSGDLKKEISEQLEDQFRGLPTARYFPAHVISNNSDELAVFGTVDESTHKPFKTFILPSDRFPSLSQFQKKSLPDSPFQSFDLVLLPLSWVTAAAKSATATQALSSFISSQQELMPALTFGVSSLHKCPTKRSLERLFMFTKENPKSFSVLHARNDPLDPCDHVLLQLEQHGMTPLFEATWAPSFLDTSFQEYRIALELQNAAVVVRRLSALPKDAAGALFMVNTVRKWLPLTLRAEDVSEKELFPVRRALFPAALSLLWTKDSTRKPFNPPKTQDGKFFKFPENLEFVQTPKSGFVPGVNEAHLKDLEGQRKAFYENEDLIVVENFFDEETFRRIEKEADRVWRVNGQEPNCNMDGKDRAGGYILDDADRGDDEENSFYNLIYNNEALKFWVASVFGKRMFAADFPVELREYGTESKVIIEFCL